jgi:hypothetical protein
MSTAFKSFGTSARRGFSHGTLRGASYPQLGKQSILTLGTSDHKPYTQRRVLHSTTQKSFTPGTHFKILTGINKTSLFTTKIKI